MPANPCDCSEKLCLPTSSASDWDGAGSVGYLALETSIKPGMLCFSCVTDLVSSDLWLQITNTSTDIYLNCVCVKVYEIRVFKV